MSTFIIHAMIPVVFVLAFGIFQARDAWKWSWAGWLNDIDYLGWMAHVKWEVPNVHRALFHNVFLLAVLVGFSVAAWRRWKKKGGESLRLFAQSRPGWVLVPFFYMTHLVLDTFQGGIVPFWPFSWDRAKWEFEILVDTSKPIPQPQVFSETSVEPGVPPVSEVYGWMDGEEFAFFLLYAFGFLLWQALQLHERRRIHRAMSGGQS